MDEYDGRQFVGIDLHRQRSVIVRQSESGEQLSAVRILNDPASLQLQLEQAGIMAVFGAPLALEDHAVRACLAALEIQDELAGLAAQVGNRDGVELALRIGLNSGQVIAGEVGSTSLGYTTIGEQVGMAQRMALST